ncbi:hypothetical protein EmuJ_001000900 [Echinococcus multilocularis]|uniref:Uncharacterized protein n=1 Tax=Echinococcus multilocularis TaxID=6211 RepID=A0A068YJ42_ECHMU|nr:hypothetical protein EmuJ_001000900 [Echinococcus multilocularis]
MYSSLSNNFLAQPVESPHPHSFSINQKIYRKRPRVEDTVNDIIRQAKHNNTDGSNPCSTNPYRPWRSIRDLSSDTYGQGAIASVQSFYNSNGNLCDQKPLNCSLMPSELTPQHRRSYSSSVQFNERRKFSRHINDCALLAQPSDNEDDQPHISSSACSASFNCNCNETSRKTWLNPFHATSHFNHPGNPLGSSYPTGYSTCSSQSGLLPRNSSDWHCWRFRNRPYLETASPIHEPTPPENVFSPSSRFPNNEPLSSNHLESFSHIQDLTGRVANCRSLFHDCRSPFLSESHLGILEDDRLLGNLYAGHKADKSKHSGAGERRNGSLSSSLIADLTKDWSPLAICRDDGDNVRKNRTQSVSIQTENTPSTNTAVQTDDYLVVCQECKKLRSTLDRILHHQMNRLDSPVPHANLEHFRTSTPRLPSNSSQIRTNDPGIGFISPVTNGICTVSDFQKSVRTGPLMLFAKNKNGRLLCKGLDLSGSNED